MSMNIEGELCSDIGPVLGGNDPAARRHQHIDGATAVELLPDDLALPHVMPFLEAKLLAAAHLKRKLAMHKAGGSFRTSTPPTLNRSTDSARLYEHSSSM
jgi:hypothetical protein